MVTEILRRMTSASFDAMLQFHISVFGYRVVPSHHNGIMESSMGGSTVSPKQHNILKFLVLRTTP